MFSIVRASRRALLGPTLGISSFNLQAAVPAVGATAGQFAVQSGAASYSIPLSLPPGLGEMKPELSLVYNSNGGDGPLGQGWSISGLSAITSCPHTLAQDGKYVPVDKSMPPADQRFCLDGQRLVPTFGSWGSANLVMRTEIDSFAKVTIGAWTGAVPTYFVVKTKAGQTMTYGETGSARSHDATSGSSPAIAWFVNKISDAIQNTISFKYERDAPTGVTSETRIKRIDYTGNREIDAYASVLFDYTAGTDVRPDVSHYHAAGYRFVRSKLLNSITTTVNTDTNIVRTYKLGYGSLVRTGTSVVNSITECATKAHTEYCLPSTTFTWNQNEAALFPAPTDTSTQWGSSEWVRTGDFNGDGLTDIASPSGGSVYVKLAKQFGGFTVATWSTISNWPNVADLMTGDFDGDGRTDFAFRSGDGIVIKFARPQSSAFVDAWAPLPSLPWGSSARTFVAELNGDGMSDIVSFSPVPGTATSASAVVLIKRKPLTSSDAVFIAETWNYTCNCSPPYLGMFGTEARENFSGDWNGDGITDFVSAIDSNLTGNFITYYQTNSKAKTFTVSQVSSDISNSDRRLRWLADFDGDGLSEIGVIVNAGGYSTLKVMPPPGRGLAITSKNLPAQIADNKKDWTWAFDFNGDGRTDIVTLPTFALVVYQQTGTGFISKQAGNNGISWGSHENTWLGDFDGDGRIDFASRYSGGSTSMLYSQPSMLQEFAGATNAVGGQQPDAISQIESGDDAVIKIDYRTLAQAPTGNTAPNPSDPLGADAKTVAAPIWLVNEVWSSHGAGAPTQMRGTQYQYFNLRISINGRGVLGFEAETVRDLLTGDYEVTRFETAWPKSGMVLRKDSYLSDGTVTRSLAQTLEVSGNTTSAPAFPYVKQSTETVYDETGMPMITTTTDQFAPDPYGNFTQIDVTTSDALGRVSSKQASTHTYGSPNTAEWILGRLNRTTVTHTATGSSILLGSPTATKTASFAYHQGGSSGGLLKSETVEPDSTGSPVRTYTLYAYDAYGHKSSVSVSGSTSSGAAMTARLTQNQVTYTPGSNELETTTTNAANHVSQQRMSLIHGGVTWSQDSNGQQIEIEYDAFGRKLKQSQGAVYTTWTYEWANGEVPNAVQKITTHHSTGAHTVVYQDLMGRPVSQRKLGLGGRESHEDTIYDAQGRVIQARRPAFANEVGAAVLTRYDARGRISEIESPGPGGSRITTR